MAADFASLSLIAKLTTPNQSIIEDYATRLRQSVTEDQTIRDFRERYGHRFQELCMMHLSILIDIPWDLFEQRPQEHTPKSALKRLLAGSRINPQPLRTDVIAPTVVQNIINLIEKLDTNEACSVEGIFRKPGHTIRKRHVQEAVLQPEPLSTHFPWTDYTTHDLASALKSVLTSLPSPLLTNKLLPLFHRVAALRRVQPEKTNPFVSLDDSVFVRNAGGSLRSATDVLLESKQLKAIRLLLQLIPSQNQRVLGRLVQLLARIVRMESKNRMSCASLGTVFGPVLFPIGSDSGASVGSKICRPILDEIHQQYQQAALLCAILIEAGPSVFHLPRSLAEDVHVNSAHISDGAQSHANSLSRSTRQDGSPATGQHAQSMGASPAKIMPNHVEESPPPLITNIRFATPTLPTALGPEPNTVSTDPAPWHPDSMDFNLVSTPNNASRFPSDRNTPNTGRNHSSLSGTQCPSEPAPVSAHIGLTSSCLPANAPCKRRESHFLATPVKSLHRRSSFAVLPAKEERSYSNIEDVLLKQHAPLVGSEGSLTEKTVKKRRYTELKFPTRIHQKEARKNLFSPCPPLKMFPFRRAFFEKRSIPPVPLETSVN